MNKCKFNTSLLQCPVSSVVEGASTLSLYCSNKGLKTEMLCYFALKFHRFHYSFIFWSFECLVLLKHE